MKKYMVYMIVLLIGVGVFLLQFNYVRKYQPSIYYQVYLDNEKIGVIKSKEEFERYIKSQGAIIKEQVEKYSVDVDRVKIVKELRSKVINKKNIYYADYAQLIKLENLYNILYELVGDDGKLVGDYNQLNKLYNSINKNIIDGTKLTESGIEDYDKIKDNIDNLITLKEKNIIDYIYSNRNKLDLTSNERSNIEDYVANKLDSISYSKYVYRSKYIEDNSMYLYADNIYEPLGINIKKISTYNNEYMSIEDVYDKIVEKKPCTIEGYQFKIKKTTGVVLNNKTLMGAIGTTDYKTISNSLTEDIIVYVTDPEVFNSAVEELAIVFVGTDEYEAYKNNKQKEITDTGSQIENIYLKEDITIRPTNISVKEKIYNNSSDLASYLLYGDKIETSTVYASADDTITSLAYKNGISVEEFFLSNPNFNSIYNMFYDGQPITITKLNPKVSLVIEETQVEDKSIDFKIVEKYDNNMIKGEEKVEQEGSNGLMRVHQTVQKVNGSISYVELISNETIKNSKDKIVLVGTKEIPNVGSTSSWGWPTPSGYTLTSYFGYRSSPFGWGRELHSGLDIAGVGYGAPVYASNNGTIVVRTYHYSYGNYIIIDHNNGYWSLYGHMSRFQNGLSVGSTVSRGQTIGYVGKTGSATGPHLHFEIRVGKNLYANVTDPLPYLRK